MLIDAQPDLEVVGEAGDGRAALQALAVTRTDVVLMHVRMPRLDGVQATERLLAQAREDRPAPKVLVLTTFDLDGCPPRARAADRRQANTRHWPPSTSTTGRGTCRCRPAPLVLWGPLLAAVTVAYHRRRGSATAIAAI